MTYLAVDLEPDVTLRTALDDWANRHETDDERLALLDGDMHLLADFGATKEVAGRDHTAARLEQRRRYVSRQAYLRSPYFATKPW